MVEAVLALGKPFKYRRIVRVLIFSQANLCGGAPRAFPPITSSQTYRRTSSYQRRICSTIWKFFNPPNLVGLYQDARRPRVDRLV